MRHDADCAANGVGAEQGALRALEDLNPVDVQEILVRADRACEKYAVDVDAHAGIQVEREVVLPDAAYRGGQHRAVGREGGAGIEIDSRREIADRVDVREVAAGQCLGGEGGHRNRHVLYVLRPPLRGHDDFLKLGLLGRRICTEHN